MNPEQRPAHQIDMNYRFKYIAIGIILYVVGKYTWKLYKKNENE